MKEMERSNRVAMIAHGVINACMLFISVIGFVEHTVSAPVLVVLILLGIIPVLAEFICWKRDHETKAIKHLSLIGFALFYTVLLFYGTVQHGVCICNSHDVCSHALS